jgi:hypothetical protein
MAAVNLLGRVLDTPDSITAAPDYIGSLYKSVSLPPAALPALASPHTCVVCVCR